MSGDKQQGLLLVYGKGLQDAGVPFIAPIHNGYVTKVREAMRVCADRWPQKDRRIVHRGRWATGEFSKETTGENMQLIAKVKAWRESLFVWDEEAGAFVLFNW